MRIWRPDGGETVVGDAAEQQRSRCHRLVQLELLTLRSSRERVSPADALERLRPALFAVTTALGVPLSAALPPGEATGNRPVAITGDAIEAVLIDRFSDVSTVTELYRTVLGAGLEQHSKPHAPGVTEPWIVYAGVLELGPVDSILRLEPGDSATFRGDLPHLYRAEDADVVATLLVRYPR